MKNQYFADERDYLKYDLLQETTERMTGIERLTLIPMLTRSDMTGQGNKKDYPKARKRDSLHKFLKNCIDSNQLNILQLRSYFKDWEYEYCPYWDDTFFDHQYRDQYFKNIPGKYLNSAVVFLDPDTGLEKESRIRSSDRDRYLNYAEVSNLYQKMNEGSAIVIYQHRPQGWSVAESFEKIRTRLENRSGITRVSMISDGQICFFGIGKEQSKSSVLERVWEDYAKKQGHYYCADKKGNRSA